MTGAGIPTTWRLTPLSDLGAEIRDALRPRSGETYELFSVPAFDSCEPEVVDGGTIRSTKRVVSPGDLLICKINPRINRVWQVPVSHRNLPQLASTEYLTLRPHDQRMGPYLLWYCRSPQFRQWVETHVEGVTGSHTRVKSPTVLRHLVPVAPAYDWGPIVSTIEEEVSRLDTATASVLAGKARLNPLRRAAYHAAMLGDWPSIPLNQLTRPDRPICYGILKPKPNTGGVVPYIEVKDIIRGSVSEARIHLTSQKLHDEYRRSIVRSGDVVIAIRGSFGRCAVVPDTLDGANMSRDVARISPTSEVLSNYLALALESPDAAEFFRAKARGVGVQGINIGDLRKLPVPLPPLAEQRRAIDAAAIWIDAEDRLRSELENTIRRAGALRAALLAAAFTGRLVNGSVVTQTDQVLRTAVSRMPSAVAR